MGADDTDEVLMRPYNYYGHAKYFIKSAAGSETWKQGKYAGLKLYFIHNAKLMLSVKEILLLSWNSSFDVLKLSIVLPQYEHL